MSWEKVKLGEISLCIQPGPFGSQLHNSDYADEGTPIVMPKDMVDGHIRHTGLIRVPEEHVTRLQRHQVYEGNLMVARKGDVRKCVYITQNENGWLTGSDCLKVALNESCCFPKYIYYQLRSPYIGKWLEQISIGATMPSINTGLLATVYKGNIIKNLIMDCQSYTKYRPNETTGGIFVSWRRKEELPTGA